MRWRVVALAILGLLVVATLRVAVNAGDEDTTSEPSGPSVADVISARSRPSGSLSDAELQGLAFEDVTTKVGLTAEPTRPTEPTAFESMTGGTAATTRDGSTTVLLTSELDPVRLVQWRAGRFADVTRPAGLGEAGTATAALFVDLDGDGDDDLVLGHQGHDTVVTVWRNDDGRYVEATRQFGIEPSADTRDDAAAVAVRGIAAGDVDGDGRVDLVVTDVNQTLAWAARYGDGVGPDAGDEAACSFADAVAETGPQLATSQTRLYLGTAGGRYTDATQRWGLQGDTMFAQTPLLVDVTGDGRLDLLTTGIACTSRVHVNDGGRRFRKADVGDPRVPQANGAVVRDFDGDSMPDWLVTGIAFPTDSGACPALTMIAGCRGNVLLTGAGDGTFSAATDTGWADAGWAFGVAAEDFANTGRLQVAMTSGFTAAGAGEVADGSASQWNAFFGRFADDPMAFFVRGEDGEYVDVAAQVGLDDTGAGRSLLALDYDGDGRLDLMVNDADTGPHLFRNVTPTKGRHWIRIRLDDTRTPTNRAAWGARVRVTSAAGAATDCWITSNTSYQTASTSTCHVGLGASAAPVQVEVWWPGTSRVDVHAGVGIDRETVLSR